MLHAAAVICVLVMLGLLVVVDDIDRTRRSRLYRTQVRWAEELDRQAGRPVA